MRKAFRRTAPQALLAALAAGALCGCGTRPDPLPRVVDAATKTLALPGVVYELRLDGSRLFGPSLQVAGARAAYDLRAGIGYEALTLHTRDGSSQLLYLDFKPGALYVTPSPVPEGALPPGKIWISAAFSRRGTTAARASLAAEAEGLAPELALAEIAWGADTAEHVGTRVVRHVPMDEYRVSADLEQARAAARRAGRAAVAAAISGELATGAKRVSFTVWVNGPGYIGRIDHSTPGSGLGAASFTFSSFNVTFARTTPSPAQTVSLDSLAQPSRSLWAIATGS